MKKPTPQGQGIEAITIKRASVTDSDKVRYRVYRAADDFVAVIAESALMAMRVAGIDNPYRIVRDLPNEGVAIEAQRMHKTNDPERIMLATQQKNKEPMARLKAELPAKPVSQNSGFVPMHVKDFKKPESTWAMVLTSDMVRPAEVKKPVPAPAPPPAPAAAAPEPAPVPVPPAPSSDELSEEEVQKLLNG